MFGAFTSFGKLGALASSVARAWSPLALWPDGVDSPGMWIDPSLLTASFNDYLGTTPVEEPGTVADSSNPVGLALDIRAGATTVSDPGHHMLQATSAARPLESARVNQITYSEDLSNAAWFKTGTTATTATRLTEDSSTGAHTALNGGGTLLTKSASVRAGAGTRRYMTVWSGASGTMYCTFDLQAGVITEQGAGVASASIAASTSGGYWCIVTFNSAGAIRFSMAVSGTSGWNPSYAGDGAKYLDIYATQLEFWNPSAYQRVGAASDYTATGITPWQLYDGVDDGMATASFAAGTLINGMDCMIAVRRDSGANCVAGLYNGIADATKFFGMAESASGSGCVGSGAGAPTVWVDNTQLTGGTAVTRGTLHTALTAGSYHILEFRNLDLSAWTATGFGLYTSYVFPGARGDIMLFESTASTADKDAARQYLADKYGVTL